MIQDKDIELIEKYLSDNLTEEERKVFDEKKIADKAFAEEIEFRENLKVASERIVVAEFKSMFNDIASDYSSEKQKKKKIFLYSIVFSSAAAVVLLFIFLINPMINKYRIENYVAVAENITTLSLQNISPGNLRSDKEIKHISPGSLEVAFIIKDENDKNYDRYFFNKDVLYLFKQSSDTINLYYEINIEGRRIYYLLRNNQLFRFEQSEENELFKLYPTTNAKIKSN